MAALKNVNNYVRTLVIHKSSNFSVNLVQSSEHVV